MSTGRDKIDYEFDEEHFGEHDRKMFVASHLPIGRLDRTMENKARKDAFLDRSQQEEEYE